MALSYPLATGFFKKKEDGSSVFFPWGFWGRGHIIPSEKDYERLHEQMSACLGVLLMLMVVILSAVLNWSDGWKKLYHSAVVVLLCMGPFAAWAVIQSRHLMPTDDRLTLDEWAANTAYSYTRSRLWISEITNLVWVLGPIFAIAWRPETGLGMIVIGYYGVFLTVTQALILRAKKQQESQPSRGVA